MKKLNFFQNSPKTPKIDVDAYLGRISQKKEVPSFRYLKELQKAHLIHIPFENLDIHYGSKITLDYRKVFDKVVTRKRGGFCYELNGLFYHLLSNLGFDCYVISAEVKSRDSGEFGRPFDHMAVLVFIDDEMWMADVGFGDGIINPLKIEVGEVQMDYTKYWRIEKDPDENLILKVSKDTSHYESVLRFTTKEKQLIQFIEMCEYHQTAVASPFTQKKLVTRLLPNGRVTLTDRKLKISELGEISESNILHEDEFLSKLNHHFGISFEQLIPKET